MTETLEAIWAFGLAAATLWTLQFFILLGFVLIVSFGTRVKYDSYWGTGIIVLAALGFLALAGGIHPLTYTYENPWVVAIGIVGYGCIGLCWTCFRWVKAIRKYKQERDAIIYDFTKNLDELIKDKIRSHNHKQQDLTKGFGDRGGVGNVITDRSAWEEIDSQEMSAWVTTLLGTASPSAGPKLLTDELNKKLDHPGRFFPNHLAVVPTWRDNKKDYGSYFFYWPLDVLIYSLSELLRDIWKFIANKIQVFMDLIARRLAHGPVNVSED